MSFDNSRFIFNPWNDYCGVVMEQGRVQLDSDWNEWLAELGRRIRAGTMDTLGRAVYPSTTPFAFKIAASHDAAGNHIAIGAGRMYVDGLLAENHGPAAAAVWDPGLDEMSGAPQIAGAAEVTIDFVQQPYFPGATLPAGNGPFLVYLDVWLRPVTYLEDPTLVDKAVAVDTTGRLQTVWQVKLLDVSGVAGGVTCATPDKGIGPWEALIQPPAGQLTNGVVSSAPSGPCCLTSNTGFTGLENQFYRVEIHQPGALAAGAKTPYPLPGKSPTATFKWSRDNGSVQTGVTAIAAVHNTAGNPASQLTVLSMGRDQVLGFAPGNWIEITDNWQELSGLHGELHQIDSIDFAGKTITLDSSVTAASFPTNANGLTDPSRHTRITRWDQSGKVYLQDGVTVWVDLGAAGATGDIPVPPAGTTLILENGITVTFGLNPGAGSFHTGDFWAFAARTADGSVDPLVNAYPFGPHHHYARLSVVTFPTSASDCRIEWPPAAGGGGCCECTITVQPTDLTGGKTLQTILDQFKNLPPFTTICLMPGTYSLPAPLRFQSAHANIRIKASQEGTVTIQAENGQEKQFVDGMVVMDNVSNVGLTGLKFNVPIVPFPAAKATFAGVPVQSLPPEVQSILRILVVSIAVRTVNCGGLTIEDCEFDLPNFPKQAPNSAGFGVGILASGQCSGFHVMGNMFQGEGTFLAGFLLVPSVVFASPGALSKKAGLATITLAGSPVVQSAMRSAFLRTPELKPLAAPVSAPVNPVTGGIVLDVPGANFNAALAANGGTVLPSSIDESLFDENSFADLTIGALVLAQTSLLSFTRNTVENGAGGFWILSPVTAPELLGQGLGTPTAYLSIAMGYPLPQGDTTPASDFVTIAPAPASTRIYAGPKNFSDSTGATWLPDVAAKSAVTISGGNLFQPAQVQPITNAQPAASDQTLYQYERFGNSFSYTFPKLPMGFYQVTLKFAEIFYTNPQDNKGVRVFNVSINGSQVLTNFDIVANAGAADTADDQTFPDIVPDKSGQIVIQFTGTNIGKDTNAKISAVAIDPQWAASPTGLTGVQQFYFELVVLAAQAFAGSQVPAMRLRVEDNETEHLTSSALFVLGADFVEARGASSLLASGNRMAVKTGEATVPGAIGIFFSSAATVAAVTRALVNGNMFLNQGTIKRKLSLLVIDPVAPPPEIMVSANVCEGLLLVEPEHYPPSAGVPTPMDSWGFLNTVLP